jgi:hypothetical protein
MEEKLGPALAEVMGGRRLRVEPRSTSRSRFSSSRAEPGAKGISVTVEACYPSGKSKPRRLFAGHATLESEHTFKGLNS